MEVDGSFPKEGSLRKVGRATQTFDGNQKKIPQGRFPKEDAIREEGHWVTNPGELLETWGPLKQASIADKTPEHPAVILESSFERCSEQGLKWPNQELL